MKKDAMIFGTLGALIGAVSVYLYFEKKVIPEIIDERNEMIYDLTDTNVKIVENLMEEIWTLKGGKPEDIQEIEDREEVQKIVDAQGYVEGLTKHAEEVGVDIPHDVFNDGWEPDPELHAMYEEQIEQEKYERQTNDIVKPTLEELEQMDYLHDTIYIPLDEHTYGNNDDYDTVQFTYYEGDGILADERQQIIPDPETIVGELTLNKINDMTDENEVVYVRNSKIDMDIEIVRVLGKYTVEVLGYNEE